jgi:hypothetical protein
MLATDTPNLLQMQKQQYASNNVKTTLTALRSHEPTGKFELSAP